MVELLAKTACAGLLPRDHGDLTLREAEDLSLTCVMPYAGGAQALAALGLVLPEAGWQVPLGDGMLRWFGRESVLCLGGALPEGVAAHAAVSDQSDAWARMVLSGRQAEQVLARLVPVDLRARAFGVDRTCRTLLGHMSASITRVSEEVFEIMVFRSMARTAVHELSEAMAHVTARSSI